MKVDARRLGGGEVFGFEKLEVWQASIRFANEVYRVTKAFPGEERFGLTSQLRRAAVSISANVAEGSSRTSARDFVRFIEIAFGSLMEVVSHLTIARHQGLLPQGDYQILYDEAQTVSRMLSGLRTSLIRKRD